MGAGDRGGRMRWWSLRGSQEGLRRGRRSVFDDEVGVGGVGCIPPVDGSRLIPGSGRRQGAACGVAKSGAGAESELIDAASDFAKRFVGAVGHESFVGERFAYLDAELLAEEAGKRGAAAGPGLTEAVDADGEDGALGAFEHEGHAALELVHAAVVCAGALGEDDDGVAVLEAFEGALHGGEVGLAAADGDGIECGDEPAEDRVFEEADAGDEVEVFSSDGDTGEGRVEIGLVIHDDDERPGHGDVVRAEAAVAVEGGAEDMEQRPADAEDDAVDEGE